MFKDFLGLRITFGRDHSQETPMTRLLFIEASPRSTDSLSSELARFFLDQLAKLNPALSIDRLNVWKEELPAFDGAAIAAKYARLSGRELDQSLRDAWDGIATMVARLDAADAIVLSTPMWNLSIPYRLKHWIDLITQPGLSFTFDPATGYTPLLRQRPLAIVLSSAGDFSSGLSFGRPDLASSYLKAAFRFIGLDGSQIIPAAPSAGPPERVAGARKEAAERLTSLAETFLRSAT
jgi:FMN-dependent NADH-azoreductase